MSTFYRKAWQVLFVIFYPFITLFSLLFIGLVSVISAISRMVAPAAAQTEVAESKADGWQPFTSHHGLYLSRKAVHEVQFGPVLYHYRTSPAIEGMQHSYWSDFAVPMGDGFILQRWPTIAEHELEQFELVYVRPGLESPLVIATMPTFYWEVEEHDHDRVEVIWKENQQEKRLVVDAVQLP
jgi:hypothetical protein